MSTMTPNKDKYRQLVYLIKLFIEAVITNGQGMKIPSKRQKLPKNDKYLILLFCDN